jgi:hypothetical protein
VPLAVVFLLRAVVLVLLWGFVVATVVAVRHDVFGTRPSKRAARAAAAPVEQRVVPPTPSPAASPAPPPATSGRGGKSSPRPARLVAVEGPSAGTGVALSSLPVTIGRAADSTVVLADDYVSNHHARLSPHGDDWLVEDTGSTNGTYVDERRITAPTVAAVGTRIRIGRNVLEVQG